MIEACFFIGESYEFLPGTFIYPPTIKQVLKTKEFSFFRKTLTISEYDIEDAYLEKEKKDNIKIDTFPTPLDYIFSSMEQNPDFIDIVKKAFYFFTHSNILILKEKKKIVFTNTEKIPRSLEELEVLPTLSADNFFHFQNLIRQSLGEEPIERIDPNEDVRIKKMKAKARYRDRIKAEQGLGINLDTSLTSICCMQIGITPLNIGEMAYASISRLTERYQEKEKYTNDFMAAIQGAKVKIKYWIRNLKEKNK